MSYDFESGDLGDWLTQGQVSVISNSFDPQTSNTIMKWLVEDGAQRRTALQTIQRSINLTNYRPSDARNMNAYLAQGRNWLDTRLGPLVDPNNAFGDRSGMSTVARSKPWPISMSAQPTGGRTSPTRRAASWLTAIR